MPAIYDAFQDFIGGNRLRRWFVQAHVRARPGEKVIDVGCGPGQILSWLPAVDYLGFDINRDYIASANENYGNKATFVVGDTSTVSNDPRFRDADIVIGLGILHHLDDEQASNCLRFAHGALKRGGRFVCLEACWLPDQGLLSRFVMSRDRGRFIRTEQGYLHLMQEYFRSPEIWIQRKPLRVPYITIVFECEK